MKIAYLSGNRWPGREPGLSFSLHNARGFSDIGADLTLILSTESDGAAAEIETEFFGGQSAVNLYPIKAPLLSGSRQLFYWLAYRHLKRERYDLVIFRALSFLPWAARFKRKFGIPVWFEAHDFWSDPSVRDEVIKKSRQRNIRLEQSFVKEMDGIFCVSEPQAEHYRRCYPELPVIAAPTSCQPPRESTRTEFGYTLGYVGSLDEAKYPLSCVLKALSLVAEPRVRLITVGARNEQQQAELRAQAEELGVSDRVEIHGWKVGAELVELEAQMDVGIACLAGTFLNRIASPLKVLEYLSNGLPFIATRLDGISRLVRDGIEGQLVENTPEAWATAIDSMYADFASWQSMSRACTTAASRMGWDARAKLMTDALNEWRARQDLNL